MEGPFQGFFRTQFDVAGVPEDPPEEAEENDDGTQVKQQVAVEQVSEDPSEQHCGAHSVEHDAQPKEMPATAQAPPLPGLVDRVSRKLHGLPLSREPGRQRRPAGRRSRGPAEAAGSPWQRAWRVRRVGGGARGLDGEAASHLP